MRDRSEYTPIQRALMLYMELEKGQIINLNDWGRSVGVTRQAVYHQLELMSSMGIPIVQLDTGKWVLQRFAERYAAWEEP